MLKKVIRKWLGINECFVHISKLEEQLPRIYELESKVNSQQAWLCRLDKDAQDKVIVKAKPDTYRRADKIIFSQDDDI